MLAYRACDEIDANTVDSTKAEGDAFKTTSKIFFHTSISVLFD